MSKKHADENMAWMFSTGTSLETVQETAIILRDDYVRLRRVHDDKFSLSQPMMDPEMWHDAAVFVLSRNINPSSWVTFLFSKYIPFPFMNVLISEKCLQEFKERAPHIAEDLEKSIVTQLEYIQGWRMHNPDMTIADILLNPAVQVGDLFAWCIATRSGHFDLAKRYEAVARKVLQRKEYREVYAKYFPKVLDLCR